LPRSTSIIVIISLGLVFMLNHAAWAASNTLVSTPQLSLFQPDSWSNLSEPALRSSKLNNRSVEIFPPAKIVLRDAFFGGGLSLLLGGGISLIWWGAADPGIEELGSLWLVFSGSGILIGTIYGLWDASTYPYHAAASFGDDTPPALRCLTEPIQPDVASSPRGNFGLKLPLWHWQF
jgi:hypothetical protein